LTEEKRSVPDFGKKTKRPKKRRLLIENEEVEEEPTAYLQSGTYSLVSDYR
jgi:hypothetical protein